MITCLLQTLRSRIWFFSVHLGTIKIMKAAQLTRVCYIDQDYWSVIWGIPDKPRGSPQERKLLEKLKIRSWLLRIHQSLRVSGTKRGFCQAAAVPNPLSAWVRQPLRRSVVTLPGICLDLNTLKRLFICLILTAPLWSIIISFLQMRKSEVQGE